MTATDLAASSAALHSARLHPHGAARSALGTGEGKGKGSALIRRLIHIPSEPQRVEVCWRRIIINTRAVSPLHESRSILHNHTANGGSEQTLALRGSRVDLSQGTKFIPISVLM